MLSKFKRYARTITKKEFLNKASKQVEIEIDNVIISCPGEIGLKESKYCYALTYGENKCYNCWEQATNSIVFKQ